MSRGRLLALMLIGGFVVVGPVSVAAALLASVVWPSATFVWFLLAFVMAAMISMVGRLILFIDFRVRRRARIRRMRKV